MLVNECSLYRHSKPFPSILSKEQEEVAFQLLNCLRASAQSSLRNSHRILNYCYWAFLQPAGVQVSYLTNAFSSQENRVCSACPWGAVVTFCRARGQQHEAPSNAAKSLSLPHPCALQTKQCLKFLWNLCVPCHVGCNSWCVQSQRSRNRRVSTRQSR